MPPSGIEHATFRLVAHCLNQLRQSVPPGTAVHSVTFCWWTAVNRAVSQCDLSIILVQLLLEHHVQVIHTTVDGKTKGFKCKLYTVHNMYATCIQWTGGDVVNCFCYFRG